MRNPFPPALTNLLKALSEPTVGLVQPLLHQVVVERGNMKKTILALLLTVLALVGGCEVAGDGSDGAPAETINSQQLAELSCCSQFAINVSGCAAGPAYAYPACYATALAILANCLGQPTADASSCSSGGL
jgi:hypothetical protein